MYIISINILPSKPTIRIAVVLHIAEVKILFVGLSLLYFIQSIVLMHACDAEVLHISCNMATHDFPNIILCMLHVHVTPITNVTYVSLVETSQMQYH